MDSDITIGLVILVCSVTTMLVLTLWSRKRIDAIAKRKQTTARAIMKDLSNGR